MMTSSGGVSDEAPGQTGFLHRERINDPFKMIRANRKKSSRFNQWALFLELLMGGGDFESTAWTDGASRPAERRHRCQGCWPQGRDQAGIKEGPRRRRRLTARRRGVLV